MGKAESLVSVDRKTVPTPGTLTHLEYLALYPMEDEQQVELSDFLAATQATRSLGLFIRRLRTYRPIRTPYLDFDRREIVDTKLLTRFTGSIYRNPWDPYHGHISLAGEQRLYSGDEVLTYGALIPTHFNFTHDPSRRSEAVLRRPENGRIEQLAYNEAADPHEYDEHNAQVAIGVIKHAADDLVRILGFTPGSIKYLPPAEVLRDERISWSPDFSSDDPDEFLKLSKRC